MAGPSYGNFCGIARAFEILGARWSALVVRDLLLGPKPFAELAELLPRLPAGELAARLGELADAGVVRQRDDVYELTSYGQDLEPVLLDLGRWGARSLGDPSPGDMFTVDMAILAMRATFRPEHARGVHASFEVRFGPIAIGVRVDDGHLAVTEGELPGADLIISSPVLKHLMAGELSPTDALWLGLADTEGDPVMLTTFVTIFHIPPPPELPMFDTAEERTVS
ncbi:winged helix-turn-helix transcriptional regulator [Actinophytocola oryzae]|uniref:HxlR family transcriptional regulator n=1 Tax=Actinophytocola oryzae TaxID=502181 RepID=A0A4R7UXY8_9PSEU|nr:helix-turn-helix domain-containing protein [Actinophytocola oryzae]TDV41024.1 HxlR family transcriptional regulator [Actinophytocola oryzae]